jgi:hypothetical protein
MMQRYSINHFSYGASANGEWVKYADAEAYAGERVRKSLSEGAIALAVQREREEIIRDLDLLRDGGTGTLMMQAIAYIRARGEQKPCCICSAPDRVLGRITRVGCPCACHDKKPGKIARLGPAGTYSLAFFAEKINELIDRENDRCAGA